MGTGGRRPGFARPWGPAATTLERGTARNSPGILENQESRDAASRLMGPAYPSGVH